MKSFVDHSGLAQMLFALQQAWSTVNTSEGTGADTSAGTNGNCPCASPILALLAEIWEAFCNELGDKEDSITQQIDMSKLNTYIEAFFSLADRYFTAHFNTLGETFTAVSHPLGIVATIDSRNHATSASGLTIQVAVTSDGQIYRRAATSPSNSVSADLSNVAWTPVAYFPGAAFSQIRVTTPNNSSVSFVAHTATGETYTGTSSATIWTKTS